MASRSTTPAFHSESELYEHEDRTMYPQQIGPRLGGGPTAAPRYVPEYSISHRHNNTPQASNMNAAALPVQHATLSSFPPNVLRFQPAGPPCDFGFAAPAPSKVEMSPTIPTPSVLTYPVDASLYDPIESETWIKAPTEYSSSSSSSFSSATSPDTFPQTPQTPQPDFYPGEGQRKDSFLDGFNVDFAGVLTPNGLDAATKSLPSLSPDAFQPNGLPFVPPLDLAAPPLDLFAHSMQYISPGQIEMHPRSMTGVASSPIETEETGSTYSMDLASRASSVQSQPLEVEAPAPLDRRARDDLLLDMRNRGFAYKEIKAKGNFVEAESTLRGRVRMLTKDKSARVRKPKWQGQDVKLLRRAVKHFTREKSSAGRGRRTAAKMPWKKVSEWMSDHDSSYEFAPATCAKKWDEMR